ncbi:MAG: DNA primase DnaG [Thermoproteota archaeon]
MKYLIKARVEVEGFVDKHDIIGAIFGQTENLFGEEFDLRELQDRGRLGRVQVDVRHESGRTVGEVAVPSNLDRVETALIAAMLESVERVGPYRARIRVYDIIDVRAEKIRKIVERAKEILRIWAFQKTPDLREIIREVSESVKRAELVHYGPEKLPAGPDVDKSDEIIIVEGRADVINLLRYGYTNVIALEGARERIPETIIRLAKSKRAIAFVDGDHGGDLILWELLRVADIDYVARAPPGKEVEDLTGKEIARALSNLVPAKEYLKLLERRFGARPAEAEAEKEMVEVEEARPSKPARVPQVETIRIEIPENVLEEIKSLQGTLEGIVYDSSWSKLAKVQVRDLYEYLEKLETDKELIVAYDGIVTQRMLDIAAKKGIKLVIANRLGSVESRPPGVVVVTFSDLA